MLSSLYNVVNLYFSHANKLNRLILAVHFHRFTNWKSDENPDTGNYVTALHKDCCSNTGNKGEWRTIRGCGDLNPYVCKMSSLPSTTRMTRAVVTTTTAAATTTTEVPTTTTTISTEATTIDLKTTAERSGTKHYIHVSHTFYSKKTEFHSVLCQMNKLSVIKSQKVIIFVSDQGNKIILS